MREDECSFIAEHPNPGLAEARIWGTSEGTRGGPENPKKTLKNLVLEAYFGGVLGGSRGGGVGGSFLAQKWGFPDPPENTGFPGVRGAEKVLI